jgi:DNA/RNA-binding protein KIN17
LEQVGGGKYFKAKGVVKEVVDRYGAKIRILDPKATLTLDQDDCETVIPKAGRPVLVVNGQHAGVEATLRSIETDRFSCTVELVNGRNRGQIVSGIPYEDVSKLHVE